jgi:hypothetical protein
MRFLLRRNSTFLSAARRIWPVAGLAAAVVVNLAWMGFLGYGFFKLVEPAIF